MKPAPTQESPIHETPQGRDDRVTRDAETRALDRPAQQFALAEEATVLRNEERWHKSGHSAKTLVKYDAFSIVLIALKQGARLKEHQTEGSVSIQAVSGKLQLNLGSESVVVPAGSLLALDRGLSHDVEALEDSVFVLSVCLA